MSIYSFCILPILMLITRIKFNVKLDNVQPSGGTCAAEIVSNASFFWHSFDEVCYYHLQNVTVSASNPGLKAMSLILIRR